MEHEKARWKVLGLDIDDKVYLIFDMACSAALHELITVSLIHQVDGPSARLRVEAVEDMIVQVKLWRTEGFPADHWFYVDGLRCEIRLESYEETERRLMGKKWSEA